MKKIIIFPLTIFLGFALSAAIAAPSTVKKEDGGSIEFRLAKHKTYVFQDKEDRMIHSQTAFYDIECSMVEHKGNAQGTFSVSYATNQAGTQRVTKTVNFDSNTTNILSIQNAIPLLSTTPGGDYFEYKINLTDGSIHTLCQYYTY